MAGPIPPQQAAAPAPAAPPAGAPPSDPGSGADPYKLHDHAMRAEKELEALATGLAHSGAPKQVTAAFTKMADGCRTLAKTMSRAPAPPAPKGAAGSETMSSATDQLAAAARRP